jgi:hypothetical protein
MSEGDCDKMTEQEYKSIYTGEEVDEAVGLAQTAFQKNDIAQTTGANTDRVMSQSAVTIALNQKASTSAITNAVTIHNASETAHPFIQEQFDDYIPLAQKGVADGVATLDGTGKIPNAQIPIELNDVIDCYIVGATALASDWLSLTVNGSALTPETGKIYIILTSGEYQNVIYRWNGIDSYVAISVRDLINKLDKLTETAQTVASDVTFEQNVKAETLELDTATTPTLTKGQMGWNDNEKLPQFQVNNEVNVTWGSINKYVKNVNGSQITDGQIVKITGAVGASGVLEVELATATDENSNATYAMVTQVIENNDFGYVTVNGVVNGVDTNAYVSGTQLYLSDSVAGGFTDTMPAFPARTVRIGIVGVQHAVNGTIEVAIEKESFASEVGYDNTTSGLTAENVNDAIDELQENKQAINLVFTDTVVETTDYVADTTYTEYGYRATVPLTGVVATDIAEVDYAPTEALSGIHGVVADSYAGGIYIYATEVPSATITIPTILIRRGV